MSEYLGYRPSEVKTQDTAEAYDARWFDTIEKYGSFETESYLSGESEISKDVRAKEKKDFLKTYAQNIHINPRIEYPRLGVVEPGTEEERGERTIDIDEYQRQLMQLKETIKSEEPNETVRQQYIYKINEKLASLRLLKAAQEGDMRRFKHYSEFVFGAPNKEIFDYTVTIIRTKAEAALQSDNADLKAAAQDVLDVLPDTHSETQFTTPSIDEIQLMQTKVIDTLGERFRSEPFEGKKVASEIVEFLNGAFEEHGARDQWEAIETFGTSTAMSADQETQQVKVPTSRELSSTDLYSKTGHEFTHALRRINGQRSRFKLAGLGLHRYLKAEEGVTTGTELALKGSEFKEFAGEPLYLAIGLGYGIDGTPRDFYDTFHIMEKCSIFKILSARKNKEYDLDEIKEKANTNAWNNCQRAFRGSDFQTPGAVFTKDLVYRDGNIEFWLWHKDHPEDVCRLYVAKHDQTRPDHVEALLELGVFDEASYTQAIQQE